MADPSFFDAQPSTEMVIAPGNREFFRITRDHRIVVSEGVSLDEAARAFWRMVAELAPPGWP